MKYRTQSANVLNEADDAERRLNWVLFCQEQEQILWGAPEKEWRPGDFLYSNAKKGYVGALDADCRFQGNHPRPMIQQFEIDAFTMYVLDGWGNSVQDEIVATCPECGVGWDGNGDCWICGRPGDRPIRIAGWDPPVGQIRDVEMNAEGAVVQAALFEEFQIDFNRYRFAAEAMGATSRLYLDRDELVNFESPDDLYTWVREELERSLMEALDREVVIGSSPEDGLRGQRPQWLFTSNEAPTAEQVAERLTGVDLSGTTVINLDTSRIRNRFRDDEAATRFQRMIEEGTHNHDRSRNRNRIQDARGNSSDP